MRMIAIAALCGVSCLLFLANLPSLSSLIFFLLSLFCFYKCFPNIVLRFLLVSYCAFVFSVWQAQHRLAWQLPKQLENKVITVQGVIVSLPTNNRLHTHFIFVLNRMTGKKVSNIKISLNWYGKYPRLRVGDIWHLMVKLKRIHGFVNPGGFDYARYMLQKNIRASGYVKPSIVNHLLTSR